MTRLNVLWVYRVAIKCGEAVVITQFINRRDACLQPHNISCCNWEISAKKAGNNSCFLKMFIFSFPSWLHFPRLNPSLASLNFLLCIWYQTLATLAVLKEDSHTLESQKWDCSSHRLRTSFLIYINDARCILIIGLCSKKIGFFSRNIYVDVLVFLDEWSMGIVNFLFKVGVKYTLLFQPTLLDILWLNFTPGTHRSA